MPNWTYAQLWINSPCVCLRPQQKIRLVCYAASTARMKRERLGDS